MQEKVSFDRHANFDLLRIVCTIAVITIHVSSFYKSAITDEEVFGFLYTQHIPTIVLYNTISRFAVPCFMMLSGAFLLTNEENCNYLFFYKKMYKKTGIPTLIFSGLYFLYKELMWIIHIVYKGGVKRHIRFSFAQ